MTHLTIHFNPGEEKLARTAAEAAGLSLVRWTQTVLLGAATGEPDELGHILECVMVGCSSTSAAASLREAREWIGEGFSADELRCWLDAGCRSAMHAAPLRDAGVAPEQLRAVWKDSFSRAGTALTIGGGLSRGHLAVDEALAVIREDVR